MPATTTHFGIEYALGADSVEKFPAEVSAPGAKTIDELLYGKILTLTTQSGSYTANPGDFVLATGTSSTITVPVTANALTCVVYYPAGEGELTVKAASGDILGDFMTTAVYFADGCHLLKNQHLSLLGDGTNARIIAGEPKREQEYSGLAGRTVATEYEPSATRPVQVSLTVALTGGSSEARVFCGGTEIARFAPTATTTFPYSFICNPRQKWEWTKPSGTVVVESSYLIL